MSPFQCFLCEENILHSSKRICCKCGKFQKIKLNKKQCDCGNSVNWNNLKCSCQSCTNILQNVTNSKGVSNAFTISIQKTAKKQLIQQRTINEQKTNVKKK